jgi:hypothetical protein
LTSSLKKKEGDTPKDNNDDRGNIKYVEAAYDFSDSIKSATTNFKEGFSNYFSEKFKASGVVTMINGKAGAMPVVVDDSYTAKMWSMYESAKDSVNSSNIAASAEGMMRSMCDMVNNMPVWAKTCCVMFCVSLFFLFSFMIIMAVVRRRRGAKMHGHPPHHHQQQPAVVVAPMNKHAMNGAGAAAWKGAIDMNKAGRMRLIMAATKIYLHCWIKHVYLRVKDLIRVLLAPLRTAYYVMKAIGNVSKMEMAFHMESWRVAYIAIANNAVTREHMGALKMHGDYICKNKVMTPEERQAWSQVMEQIGRYMK